MAPRITRPASWQQDEGIVQPLSKDKDQLSRRLHQYRPPAPGRGTFPRRTDGSLRQRMICKNLSKSDAAYIAGLIDGEGTITLTRKHKQENRQLGVTISSTEIGLLQFVKSATGVGKITNKKSGKILHAPSFAYAVYNRQALALLEQIQPYLKSYKKLRGRLILGEYLNLTPRNGKYSAELLAKKVEFERAVLSIRATG
jgi:LAGLIDADG endonuclease